MSMPPPPPSGPSYGAPYGGAPQPHPKGTMVLIVGIIGLFICGIILGPIAWIQGKNALDEIDRNPTAYSNRGMVQAGMILGIVATALWVLVLLINLAA